MENLNKDNFFNAMEEKYPKALAHFRRFIDRYKTSVSWDKIFNCNAGEITKSAIKFHDLPYEMQLGIFLLYGCETFESIDGFIKPHEMSELLESCFIDVEQSI